MTIFTIGGVLLIVVALLSYLNKVVFGLPRTVALLLGGVISALLLFASESIGVFPELARDARAFVAQFDFSGFVLRGVLGFLIFAGALDIDVEVLRRRRIAVLAFASLGVVISTAIIGVSVWGIFTLAGSTILLSQALLFGAIISPTDPVAVVGIMREMKIRKSLEIDVTGESLLNDGVAIILFSLLATIAFSPERDPLTIAGYTALLFVRQIIGGCLVGLGLGFLVYRLLKRINDPEIEVLMSFALVVTILLVSEPLGVSSPLGCAVAGLFIGHRARNRAMAEPTRVSLDIIWSFTAQGLDAILFLLLGIEVFALGFPPLRYVAALVVTIGVVLLARLMSLYAAAKIVRDPPDRQRLTILTWGGLRGGVSLALALSLPPFAGHDALVDATYAVVLFSVVVQGLTIAPLLKRMGVCEE